MAESCANSKFACGDSPAVESKALNGNAETNPKENLNESKLGEGDVRVNFQPAAGGDNNLQQIKDNNANTKEIVETNNNQTKTVPQLEGEILKRTVERDSFQKKLEETERKLADLQVTFNQITSDASQPRHAQEVEHLKMALEKTKKALDDRERKVQCQDNQIAALNKQVSSLREVVAITKDLLNIRSMEVKHLQEDVDKMEIKINCERERHNVMINKMDAAVRLNADLKKEYETQLRLFQDLRGKYEEKVILLSEENKALEASKNSTTL